MRRALIGVGCLLLLLFYSPAFGQSSSTSTDSQTLQELLREVRELRQDLRTVTVASQRAQILLSRVQAQQTAVTEAQKEVDEAHSQTNQTERRSRQIQNQIKYYTDQDNEDRTPNAVERQNIEQNVARLNAILEQSHGDEAKMQADEMQAKDKLQFEQSKLDALQSELDQIDRTLANLSSQPVN